MDGGQTSSQYDWFQQNPWAAGLLGVTPLGGRYLGALAGVESQRRQREAQARQEQYYQLALERFQEAEARRQREEAQKLGGRQAAISAWAPATIENTYAEETPVPAPQRPEQARGASVSIPDVPSFDQWKAVRQPLGPDRQNQLRTDQQAWSGMPTGDVDEALESARPTQYYPPDPGEPTSRFMGAEPIEREGPAFPPTKTLGPLETVKRRGPMPTEEEAWSRFVESPNAVHGEETFRNLATTFKPEKGNKPVDAERVRALRAEAVAETQAEMPGIPPTDPKYQQTLYNKLTQRGVSAEGMFPWAMRPAAEPVGESIDATVQFLDGLAKELPNDTPEAKVLGQRVTGALRQAEIARRNPAAVGQLERALEGVYNAQAQYYNRLEVRKQNAERIGIAQQALTLADQRLDEAIRSGNIKAAEVAHDDYANELKSLQSQLRLMTPGSPEAAAVEQSIYYAERKMRARLADLERLRRGGVDRPPKGGGRDKPDAPPVDNDPLKIR